MPSAADRAAAFVSFTQRVKARIDIHWINAGSDKPHCMFITAARLRKVWTDDLFMELGAAFSSDDFELCEFFTTTLCLISALLYYGWQLFSNSNQLPAPPFELQKWGLFVPQLGSHISDGDLPLPLSTIRVLLVHNAHEFRDGQSAFRPAVIHCENNHFCVFAEGTRLPFEYEDYQKRSGWYGDVSKVKIKKGYLVCQCFDLEQASHVSFT